MTDAFELVCLMRLGVAYVFDAVRGVCIVSRRSRWAVYG